MNARRLLWGLCGLAGVILAGLVIWRAGLSHVTFEADAGPARVTRTTGSATVGGPFQLVDQNGQTRDQRVLQGRWSAVFFGFTHCPDICPTTLQALGAAKEALGPQADRLQLVFVTVDPARDTPQALKAYLESGAFAPGVVGLTGTEAEVRQAAAAYRAPYARVGQGADYQMQHSSLIYLMNPQGEFDRVLRLERPPQAVAAEIRQAMAAGNDSRS